MMMLCVRESDNFSLSRDSPRMTAKKRERERERDESIPCELRRTQRCNDARGIGKRSFITCFCFTDAHFPDLSEDAKIGKFF